MEGNLKSDSSYFTQEESQRETESIDGGVMSFPQSPTDVSISSAPSSSLSSSVGRKRKVTAAEEGERPHIEAHRKINGKKRRRERYNLSFSDEPQIPHK
ncbi:unnamed protein product [Acanthoscelides obtectus]|uniref:Uncharacterized protein n=1 Tax=Acanthoscelides obtectus TaxID=200917 RepID=A0A9P0NVQ7_ACAOB|nr:unnamed protein product [Acanthoscelides obtectus]CAK1667903.1 hypothetical protein AOBTE_LOCUS26102 [Acanthoscelides obtectus]